MGPALLHLPADPAARSPGRRCGGGCANTDGGASVEALGNTFMYTVLLMVVMGTVMYLVYGRVSGVRRFELQAPTRKYQFTPSPQRLLY
jgi:hypothetical protein